MAVSTPHNVQGHGFYQNNPDSPHPLSLAPAEEGAPDDTLDSTPRQDDAQGLRVLHVCETAKGGIATYFNTLFEIGERDQTHNVFVVPSRHAEFLDAGLDRITYPAPSRGIIPTLRLIRVALSEARALRPDIIFTHSTFTLPTLAALRLLGVKARLVYCAHGWAAQQYNPGSFRHRVASLIENYIPGMADRVVCISSFEQEFAIKQGYRGDFTVIDNCVVDARADARNDLFAPPDDPRIHLLFVGRFDRQKGIDILQEAFLEALKTRKDIVLHLVGSAVLSGGEDDILPASENVVRHGWVANGDIDHYFRSADAVIVPSRWEAFGLVVAEAFRNGTPTLVSDRGALPSLVEDGRSGYVFELTTESIGRLLAGLTKDDLRAMRANARLAYEARHTVEHFRKNIDSLYRALIGQDTMPQPAPSGGAYS